MKPLPARTAELYCSACERMFEPSVGESCPRDGTRLVRLATPSDPFIGLDLDGRYVIHDKLGQGGMGAVYRGTQKSVDREVAIKVVSPGRVAEPEIVNRFLREARLASRINHPNAASVVDFGQSADGVFYLVMELVAGRTLSALLRSERVLDPKRVARIGAQICQALEGAHAVPIVHRDLKPANILIGPNDFVKVVDFGIAKSLSADTLSSTMTNADAILGTPSFMPPEAARALPCDERADLYSLGCVLYLAASGRLPFVSDDLPSMMMKHVVEPVPPLIGVPAALATVIYRLLEKEPDDRYQTATETRLALEGTLTAAASETVSEPPTVKMPAAMSAVVMAPNAVRESAGVTVPITGPRLADIATSVTAATLPSSVRAPKRGPWLWLAAIAVLLASIVVIVSAMTSSGGSPRATAPADSGPIPVADPPQVATPPTPVAAEPESIAVQPALVDEVPPKNPKRTPIGKRKAPLPPAAPAPPATNRKDPPRPFEDPPPF